MKFTVDIEEFWAEADEYGDIKIADELRTSLKHDVINQIKASMGEKIDKEIKSSVEKMMNERMQPIIDSQIEDCLASGMLDVSHGEPISIKSYLSKLFNRHTGWQRPEKQLEQMAEQLGSEMKLQLEGAFANKIISNMKSQGLLKDEALTLLTKEPE